MTRIRYAIVGCGLIGRKRASTLGPGQLVAACDTDLGRAQALVTATGQGVAMSDPAEAIQRPQVEAVIVATVNAALAPLSRQAIENGKHVLVEKPAGVSLAEIESLAAAARARNVRVRVGFNHRYHPSFRKARELVDAGELGPLLFVRARYGHGGRVGYEREWRADPKQSGGGELMDQGVHVIDLARWFLGEFTEVDGHAATYFWQMPVEDNAFVSLRTATGQTAWLQVSCSEWKNLFSFELYGRDGKLHVEGLGGSYGVERLSFYKMQPAMGPPETTIWEYPGPDTSWRQELEEFEQDVALRREPSAGLSSAAASLRVVEEIDPKIGLPEGGVMIIARSPLRISLGGGGTDLPSYYRKFGGFLIAAAIDKYVYITVHRTFVQELIIKYSKLERVKSVNEIEHPIIRESLKLLGFDTPSIEITSMADMAGTGLGSSGSFTTAFLKALHAYNKNPIRPDALAAEACRVELDILKEPIGKQDQYIAAYGGITCFEFQPDDQVRAWPLKVTEETIYNLEDNLLLFFTGFARSASVILKEQDDKSKLNDSEMLENMHFVKDLGLKSKAALEAGDLMEFGRLMDVHWQHKKKRSGSMSNQQINAWYDLAMANGAIGGKLIGAGGGGFLVFYTQDKARLRHAMRSAGVHEVRFRFDFEGTKVLVQ